MIALAFPGQGAQFVGMGADLAETYDIARETFAEADDVLERPLARLCFDGPLEELTETAVCQPAILAVSVATMRVARQQLGLGGEIALGHSLGEYTALVAAGAMDFATALQVVAERGAAMQAAAEARPGGMVALIGVDDAAAHELCEAAEEVWPANYNGPNQIVASGSQAGVERLLEAASEAGVRASRLQVSGAFHSPLMSDAATRVADALAGWEPGAPGMRFLSTTTCAEEPPGAMAEVLVSQLTSPVRFAETVAVARAAGVDRFVELGPGKVLSGLIRRIDRAAQTTSVGSVADVESAEPADLDPTAGATA